MSWGQILGAKGDRLVTKNAKIAVVVVVLAVIALIVVLCSTVFAVNSARLIWYNSPTGTLERLDSETALDNSGMKGASVFLLDKDKAIENLEDRYTNLRVLDIEVVWPNIVNIHAVERQEVFAVLLENGNYAITDEYLKVLDVVSNFTSTNTNPVVLEIANLSGEYQKGDTINFDFTQTFIDIYNAFYSINRDLTDMRAIFKSMEYTNAKATIMTHFGVTIIIDNPTQNTLYKTIMAIRTFDTLETENYGGGTIEVFVNADNKLESRYY